MEKPEPSATAKTPLTDYRLEAIYLYPIKSLGGIALSEARLEARGLQYDRRWMLVNAEGKFVSQREYPALTQLGTTLRQDNLVVFEKQNPQVHLQLSLTPPAHLPQTMVEVWSDRCQACLYGNDINEWFSDFLKANVRLAYMPDSIFRRADGRYAPPRTPVSFADGFPYLIIGQASLDDLNARLSQPVPMSRFRPNFVFSGGQPYEEDHWKRFCIGSAQFLAVKPCARCIVVTTDQDTGVRSAEPLRTLATYRQKGHRILFGQNAIWSGEGEAFVRVGMPLTLR
ncbi:MAG: MOSC domain-containing protein [Saprospiraceae bacterium]|nr:MOSC domain-containing protein [Saprospiraceae bacterium]MDW8229594.1 MOSC domain-containing protein [Saprospiraceae bacterium]